MTDVQVPAGCRYSADHLWARPEGDRVRVGLTDFAQDALGALEAVVLPEPGTHYARGDVLGEVESAKVRAELYAPVTGVVVEVNVELAGEPGRCNADPYGTGWICVLEAAEQAELADLLDPEGYRERTEP